MIVGNKIWFSPKRYKINFAHNGNNSFEYVKLISTIKKPVPDYDKVFHRKTGPVFIGDDDDDDDDGDDDYFEWAVNGINSRIDGPIIIKKSLKYFQWRFSGVQCTEEEYWNA